MWVRKTKEEYESFLKRKRTRDYLFLLLGFPAFIAAFRTGASLLGWFGVKRGMGQPILLSIVPVEFMFSYLVILGFFAPVLLIAFVLRLPISRDNGNRVVICDRCHTTKLRDDAFSCDCGGRLEDFNYWKWG